MAEICRVRGVRVVHWNPRERPGRGRRTSWSRLGRRRNNFGDLLGPLVVAALAESLPAIRRGQRLLAVGSILHFARDGDVVWGSGVNGKIPQELHTFHSLDVRAVRGPKTRAVLQERGLSVPAVYGDPALLLPLLRPDLVELAAQGPASGPLLVPNLNDGDLQPLRRLGQVLTPTSPLEECLRAIVRSERVVSSSLHGIVVAEAFGIPAVPVRARSENPFKYDDYFGGTGRDAVPAAATFEEGLVEGPVTPPLRWQPEQLVAAFPRDLWLPDAGKSATPGLHASGALDHL
jgi:pyruvyltransferase